jgi:peptide/nickel transport system permease protein
LLGVSTPTFIFGVFFQWLFAYHLRWLPVDGYGETSLEHLASVVLPALTMGLFGAAYYTRMVRDEMVVLGRADYVRTALAKGLSRRATLIRHVLRNALGPIVTMFGLEAGTLVGGAVVTESIFRWPGIGSLFAAAMLDRDGPVMMGCVIVTSLFIVLSTIAVDVAYALVDPRVREEL